MVLEGAQKKRQPHLKSREKRERKQKAFKRFNRLGPFSVGELAYILYSPKMTTMLKFCTILNICNGYMVKEKIKFSKI